MILLCSSAKIVRQKFYKKVLKDMANIKRFWEEIAYWMAKNMAKISLYVAAPPHRRKSGRE